MVFAADLRISLGQLNWAFPITALFWVTSASEGDFMIGYLKTLVHCAIPAGSVPAPRFSPEWSGSHFCYDKTYVVQQSSQLSGRLLSTGLVISCFSLLVLAALSDRYGRKPIMVLACCAYGIAGLCFAFAHTDSVRDKALISAGFYIFTSLNG